MNQWVLSCPFVCFNQIGENNFMNILWESFLCSCLCWQPAVVWKWLCWWVGLVVGCGWGVGRGDSQLDFSLPLSLSYPTYCIILSFSHHFFSPSSCNNLFFLLIKKHIFLYLNLLLLEFTWFRVSPLATSHSPHSPPPSLQPPRSSYTTQISSYTFFFLNINSSLLHASLPPSLLQTSPGLGDSCCDLLSLCWASKAFHGAF